MNRKELITSLQNYETEFSDEEAFIADFIELLQHPQAYSRDHLPGHMTGSAWIVDHTFENVLLTHHAKLNRWLQPGGHADGEENILTVALKEAEEETGLATFKLLSFGLFDIDIHPIPERNGFPRHLHYDVRVLLQANREDTIQISAESHDVKWVPINEIAGVSGNNISMLRMAKKCRGLSGVSLD